MRVLTPEEFKRLYGENALTGFTAPKPPTSSGFDFQSAGQVFKRAGEDVALAQQNQREQGNSPTSTIKTGATMALQGGLAIPRAVGAGLLGTETGQAVTDSVVSGLTKFGDAITPQSAKDKIGDSVMEVISGYEQMNPQQKLDQRNKLAVAEVLSYFLGGQATKTAAAPVVRGTETVGTKVTDLSKQADDAFKQATKLRENVRSYVGEKTVDPQVQASAERLAVTPTFLKGTANRAEDVVTKYDRYLKQSENAINDIKVDPAISEVGSKMGDAFEGVIKQRQAIGKVLGDELKEWGKLRVGVKEAVDNTLAELSDSGLSYNPRTRQLTSFQGSKFVPEEVAMLNEFIGRIKLLGDSPTVTQLDQLIAKTRTALAFTKGQSGVLGTTNAERIINGAIANLKESLNPSKNGIQQLNKYWKANQTYSDLSDFVEEGVTFLGKKTQSGDFAKDASIAKSAVQSILNSGKKDWMTRLEALTGYNALDDAVLALQAMKDAGDFRGLSLLQAMKDAGIPTSKAGFTGAVIDKAVEIGTRVVAGTPAEQTRAFLKSLLERGKVTPKPPTPKPKPEPVSSTNVKPKKPNPQAGSVNFFKKLGNGSQKFDQLQNFIKERTQRLDMLRAQGMSENNPSYKAIVKAIADAKRRANAQ